MKFQDSSFNGLKVRVGTHKCDPRTHAPKAICRINFFKVEGITTVCLQHRPSESKSSDKSE